MPYWRIDRIYRIGVVNRCTLPPQYHSKWMYLQRGGMSRPDRVVRMARTGIIGEAGTGCA